MKIGGIEYCVLLMIDKVNGEELDCTFSDFDEMNNYIRHNKKCSDYDNCQVRYSLVEVSEDGEIGGYSWDQQIEFEEFSDEKIRDEIESQERWLEQVKLETEEMNERLKTINYDPRSIDYKRKIPLLKEYAYVCPFCVREVDDCRCDLYPYYLVQIDRMILPIIRELNVKGYKTTGCCAGHPDQEEFRAAGIYICFDKDYDFDEPIPEGMHYFKTKHSIQISPPEDCKDLYDFQEKTLWKISDWVEMLSDLHENEDY